MLPILFIFSLFLLQSSQAFPSQSFSPSQAYSILNPLKDRVDDFGEKETFKILPIPNDQIHPSLLLIALHDSIQSNLLYDGNSLSIILNNDENDDNWKWNEYCNSFQILLPAFKFLQCVKNEASFDFDLDNHFIIPPHSPAAIPIGYNASSIQYLVLGSRRKTVEQSHSSSQGMIVFKRDGMQWIQTVMKSGKTSQTSEQTNVIQVVPLTTSGYHHKLHITVHASGIYAVSILFPKEVIVDKDELRLLQRKYKSFPDYLSTTNSSDVEKTVEMGYYQALFLFGNISNPIDCLLPIHLRYALPQTTDQQNHHHPVSLFSAALLLYDEVGISILSKLIESTYS